MAKSFLDKIFLPEKRIPEFSTAKYLKALDAGKFRDRFSLGISEREFDFYLTNFSESPNALFVGAMGSGKSVGANYTVTTWMLANMDQTILFLVDALKGAGDYASLHEEDTEFQRPTLEQVHTVINSDSKIRALIDLLYEEAMARNKMFSGVAENLTEYERKTGKKIARIVTVMEEFHSIPYVILNFQADFKTEHTQANKFHTLMRIGRSLGIWFIGCTQKSTKGDIPPEIQPNFLQKMVFKVSRGESNYLLGDGRAAEIRPDQKGRCETEYGAIQFPMIEAKTQRKLLKQYYKPLNAECAYLTQKIIKEYLSGISSKDQYRLKKIADLVKAIESYKAELVISIMHEKQGHKVEPRDALLDDLGISHIVYWNNDIKVAVMTRCESGSKNISQKHIKKMKTAMEINECTHGVIYTSSDRIPAQIYKMTNKANIEIVDHEDMRKMAYKVDMQGLDANLSPDKLADDSKESGSYQEENHVTEDGYEIAELDEDEGPVYLAPLEETEEEVNVIDLQKIQQEKESQREQELAEKIDNIAARSEEKQEEVDPTQARPESQLSVEDMIVPKKLTKKIERIKVNKLVTIRKEETPSLLVHTLKTEKGETYRVLFYILDNMKIRHKFYLDRQLASDINFTEKRMLGVSTLEEWNKQKEVLSPKDFDKEILEFLENFSPCVFPVHSVCWAEDEEFLRKYLAQCSFMINNPTVFEMHTSSFFKNKGSRSELIKRMGIKEKKDELFGPIEADYEIWQHSN